VRVAYAAALATLAKTSARFLQRAMAPAGTGAGAGGGGGNGNGDDSGTEGPVLRHGGSGTNGFGGGGGCGGGGDGAPTLSMAKYESDLGALRNIVRGVVLDYLTPEGAPGGGGGGGGAVGGWGGGGGEVTSGGSAGVGSGGRGGGGSGGGGGEGPRDVRRLDSAATGTGIVASLAGTAPASPGMRHYLTAGAYTRPLISST
jgi:hypothetical protein